MKQFIHNLAYSVFFISVLLSRSPTTLADDAPSNISQEKKALISNLKALASNKAFNSSLFKALAENTDNQVEKIAYARQAMVLSPKDLEIRRIITEAKVSLSSNEAPANLLQKASYLDILSTKSFLPFYVDDYLIIIFSILLALSYVIFRRRNLIFHLTIISVLGFLLFNKVFVTYTRDGSLRISNSISDLYKTEGIVLKETSCFSAKDTSSQVTFVLPEGGELDIVSSNPISGEWVKIGYENGRTGWIQFDPNKIFAIIR